MLVKIFKRILGYYVAIVKVGVFIISGLVNLLSLLVTVFVGFIASLLFLVVLCIAVSFVLNVIALL
jgi:hypothetical protein